MNEREHQPRPERTPGQEHEQAADRAREQQPDQRRYPFVRLAPDVPGADTDPDPDGGEWVYAAVEAVELHRCANNLLARHAHEGASRIIVTGHENFGDYLPRPDEDLATIARVARGIHTYGDAFGAKFQDADPDLCDAFAQHYLGQWSSPGAWVEAEFNWMASIRGTTAERLRATVGDDQWSVDEIAQQIWLEGRIVIAHRDGGGVWLFAADP